MNREQKVEAALRKSRSYVLMYIEDEYCDQPYDDIILEEIDAALATPADDSEPVACLDEAHDHPAHDWRMACLNCGVFRGSNIVSQPSPSISDEAVERTETVKTLNYWADRLNDLKQPEGAFALRQAAILIQAASLPKTNNADARHRFEPDKRYPWACARCGYPERETLKHIQEPS